MRLHFRPFPGLTIFTVISLIILIALGTWQYQRLQWKTAYLAEVEQAVTAPPLTSLASVEAALQSGTPVDFSRIEFDGDIIGGQTPFLVYSRRKTELSWRPFVPVESTGRAVFAALTPVADRARGGIMTTTAEPVTLAGYVRMWQPKDRGVPNSTPDMNRWFSFNPMPDSANWADSVPGGADMRYYIDTVPGVLDADTLPLKRPNIRNNHFDYMLTWYGLAVVLFVIYLILHIQRGRLGFRS
ncbi:SURF1 family protein [Fretibacter rubidus]|uniref:SURF1 family protein n=1 Tax=Fretibacter rubidus TaxID=570162 RepID=UPI003529F4D6